MVNGTSTSPRVTGHLPAELRTLCWSGAPGSAVSTAVPGARAPTWANTHVAAEEVTRTGGGGLGPPDAAGEPTAVGDGAVGDAAVGDGAAVLGRPVADSDPEGTSDGPSELLDEGGADDSAVLAVSSLSRCVNRTDAAPPASTRTTRVAMTGPRRVGRERARACRRTGCVACRPDFMTGHASAGMHPLNGGPSEPASRAAS